VDTVTPSGASLLSSLTKSLIVNDNPGRHLPSLRQFRRLERRIQKPSSPRPARQPTPQPRRAEEVLAVLATLYPAGSAICREQMTEAAGISLPTAGKIRDWARANGRWPYEDSKGGFGHRRRKGGGT
jgi:hypothetical protein